MLIGMHVHDRASRVRARGNSGGASMGVRIEASAETLASPSFQSTLRQLAACGPVTVTVAAAPPAAAGWAPPAWPMMAWGQPTAPSPFGAWGGQVQQYGWPYPAQAWMPVFQAVPQNFAQPQPVAPAQPQPQAAPPVVSPFRQTAVPAVPAGDVPRVDGPAATEDDGSKMSLWKKAGCGLLVALTMAGAVTGILHHGGHVPTPQTGTVSQNVTPPISAQPSSSLLTADSTATASAAASADTTAHAAPLRDTTRPAADSIVTAKAQPQHHAHHARPVVVTPPITVVASAPVIEPVAVEVPSHIELEADSTATPRTAADSAAVAQTATDSAAVAQTAADSAIVAQTATDGRPVARTSPDSAAVAQTDTATVATAAQQDHPVTSSVNDYIRDNQLNPRLQLPLAPTAQPTPDAEAQVGLETMSVVPLTGAAVNTVEALGAAHQALSLAATAQGLGHAAQVAASQGNLAQAAALAAQAKADGAQAMALGEQAKAAAAIAKPLMIASGSIAMIDGTIDIVHGVKEGRAANELQHFANYRMNELVRNGEDTPAAYEDYQQVSHQLDAVKHDAKVHVARGTAKTVFGGMMVAAPFTGPAAPVVGGIGAVGYLGTTVGGKVVKAVPKVGHFIGGLFHHHHHSAPPACQEAPAAQ